MMDDSRQKRTKQVTSRKPSKQEPIVEWSYSSRSPPALQNYIKNFQQNLDHEKIASQRLDLTNIQQLSQRPSGKTTKRTLTPSYAADRNTPFEPSLVYADRSRNNSPSRKSKSPLSGRITPQPSDKSTHSSRPQSRGLELYAREHSDKLAQASQQQSHKTKRRGGSNPSCLNNFSYYASRNPDSGRKENRPDGERDSRPETVRFAQPKQAWGTNEPTELNLSAFMNKRPPSAVSKKEPHVMREKKMNYMPQQQGEGSYVSKIEDSQLALRDFSKYQSQEELKIVNMGFGREFQNMQNMGLALKKENLSQKLWRDKSQEMKTPPPQFHTPVNKQYGGVLIIENNKEVQQRPVMEERPLGTEEFYEDFFSTEKMTFNFEKMRVSRRPSHQKDYFTPERTPVYANNNAPKNYFSGKEAQLALSHRPNEAKSVRARYLE